MCGPISDERTETKADKKARARNAVKVQAGYIRSLKKDLKTAEKTLAHLQAKRDAI